jgi:hypothetical protein
MLGTIGLVCFIIGIILFFIGVCVMLECDNIIIFFIGLAMLISGYIMGCIDYRQIKEFNVESVEVINSESEEYYIFLIETEHNQFIKIILPRNEAELYYMNNKFYISQDKLNDFKQ